MANKARQCDPFSIHLFYLVIVKTDPAQPFLSLLFEEMLSWRFEELQLYSPCPPWVKTLQKMHEKTKLNQRHLTHHRAMHNRQVTHLQISWAISMKKGKGWLCPKPLEPNIISGFPPSQPIQRQSRGWSQKGAWPNKIEDFSLPWVQHQQKMYELEKRWMG